MELKPKKVQFVDDAVFFSSQRVVVGTRLMNVGMREQGRIWEVVEMWSFYTTSTVGIYRRRRVDAIRKLTDEVVLQQVVGGQLQSEKRRILFCSLRYSAAWRLI